MPGSWRASRLFFETVGAIIAIEAAIMVALPTIAPGLDGWKMGLLDAVLLACASGPFILWRSRRFSRKSQAVEAEHGIETGLEPERELDDRRTHWAVIGMFVIAGIGIPISYSVALLMSREIERVTESRFTGIENEAIEELQNWVTRPVYALKGVRGVFAASEQVTRDEFRGYVESRDFPSEFPGLHDMGLLSRVEPDQPATYAETAHPVDSSLSGVIDPADTTPSWVVEFWEPRLRDPEHSLLGFDYATVPAVLEAIERATVSGEPVLTTTLPTHSAEDHSAMLWLLPLYRNGMPRNTPEERQAAIKGMLFARFTPDGITPYINDALDGMSQLDVFDYSQGADVSPEHLAAFGDAASEQSDQIRVSTLRPGGAEWRVVFHSTPEFDASIDRLAPAIVFVGGTVLSLLLGAFVITVGNGRRRAIRMAERMTEDLRRLSMVAQNTTNAVVITDADLKIVWVNAGFTRITEYTLGEVIGRGPGEVLQCQDTDPLVRQRVREALAKGRGFRGEILNQSKSGRRYWLDMDIQPIVGRDGSTTGFIAVETDLTEQKEAEQRLMEAKATAEAATAAKGRFLSAMSHEIRTPLNGIIGFADLLRRGVHADDPSTMAEWIGIIHGSGEHLLALLNDVLDLSKMDADAIDIAPLPCNPREVVAAATTLLQSRADEKDLKLEVRFEDSVPAAIRTDATRIRQILMNLVSNAVKFTEEGRITVTTSAFERDGTPMLRVVVEDTGMGMNPSQLSRLFTPFQQADKNITERFGGTGLGLSISKGLANRLGGDITVTSREGVGSSFTLEIEAPPLLPGESLPAPYPGTEPWEKESERAGSPLMGARVLIADDVGANRTVASLLMERAGATTHTVEDGEQAVQACKDQPFDLVLMDVQMPKLSGIQAARAIRDLGQTMPIIALTAFSSGADRRGCLQAGMNDFLAKPFNATVLIQTASNWILRARGGEVPLPLPEHDLGDIDPDVIDVARSWLEGVPERLAEARDALERGESERIGRIGHAIKGTGGSLGLTEFTEPAADLESAAQADDMDEVRRQLAKLQATYTAAAARLAA